MHCPRCGQQQVSAETKFCSKCGFQLAVVAELVHYGGVLPQLEAQRKQPFFSKKKGVVFSVVWFIFFTMFMTSVWGILNVEELAGLCAVTGVFGGLAILIGSLVLLPSSKTYPLRGGDIATPRHEPVGLYGNAHANALPPQQQQPATSYTAPHGAWRAPDTGDLVERGSVIENTTKLLKQDER